MQTFNILLSISKIDSNLEALHKYYQIVWNYNSFLSLILLYLNQNYIFSNQEKNNYYYKFSFFLLVTLSKIITLCLGDETKSGEKQR